MNRAGALQLLGWAVVVAWVELRIRSDRDDTCEIADRVEVRELAVVDEAGTRRLVLEADPLGGRVRLTGDTGTVAALSAHGERAELVVTSTDEAASLSAGAMLGGLVLQVASAPRAIVVNGAPAPGVVERR